MSQPSSLPLNTRDVVRQFARRDPLDAPQFLYGEIAQRMLQRLSYIRIAPKQVLDAGCGAAHALEPLRAQYPALDYYGLDACAPLLETASRRYQSRPGFWQRLRNRPTPPIHFIRADMAHTGLADESMDLVWSNLALHWHPEPHRVISEWRRVLRAEALVMFSAFGPGSLVELRTALQQAGLQTATPGFVDMHDFGDLLLQSGFVDPVMDQETITLTYASGAQLLDDVRTLGGNPSAGRRAGLAGRQWRERLEASLEKGRQQDGRIHLSMEVAYGHAWRAKIRQRAAPGSRYPDAGVRPR